MVDMRIFVGLFFRLFLACTVLLASDVSFQSEQLSIKKDQATLTTEAPQAVHDAVAAANRIAGKPYKYGGGHAAFEDDGYDCSGTVSYVLHGAGLLKFPMSSASFKEWGEPGPGKWITVFHRPGHVYLVIAGARFDTTDDEDVGPGWREKKERTPDFTARHPAGL